MCTKTKADDRLSRVMSELYRLRLKQEHTYEDMRAFHAPIEDFAEDGYFERQADEAYAILERYGYDDPTTLWAEVADRLGVEYELERADVFWDTEKNPMVPKRWRASLKQSEILDLIPEPIEVRRFNRAMANTP